MLFKSLKLQNIRSYIEETITFPEGSVLLAGDIGAGKSTILLAIEYALFGTKRSELDASSLLRNGSHAGRIELVLELQEKEIKISRTIKRTPNTIKQEAGFLVINNARLDATPMELRAKILELLGYPKEALTQTKDLIYRYTVYTPQEQMRQILYEDKETRLNTLRKVFNIDKYKRIKENAQLIAKELRTRRRILEETAALLPHVQQQRKTLSEQRQEKEKTCAEKLPLLLSIQEKKIMLQQKIAEREIKQKELQKLQQELAILIAVQGKNKTEQKQLQGKIIQIQEQISTLQKKSQQMPEKPTILSKEQLLQEIEKEEQTLQKTRQDLLLYSQEQKTIEEEMQRLEQEIASFAKISEHKKDSEQQLTDLEKEIQQKKEVEKHIQEEEQSLLELMKQLATWEIQEKTAKETIRRIQILDTCTLCLQHVEHTHKEKIITAQSALFEEAEKEFQKRREQQQLLHKKIEKEKQRLEELLLAEKKKAVLFSTIEHILQKEKEKQQKEKELQQKKRAAAEGQTKIVALQTVPLEQLQQALADKKLVLQKLYAWETAALEQKNIELFIKEKQTQQSQQEKELSELKKQEQEGKEKQQQLQKQIEKYDDLPLLFEQQKKELQETQEQEKQQEILYATMKKEIASLLEQEKLVEKEIQEKEAVQRQMQQVAIYAQWLEDFFIPLVSLMEKQVLLQLHASFQELFTQWFVTIMGDAMTARLNEEFTPVIEQNGFDVEATDLSGGEKTAVALAYRLALNKVINDFMTTIMTKEVIILDEPTDGFSAEQLDKVRDVLEELQMRQIILVSHETKMESFVEHVLRIEKTGHVSRVVS